MFGLADKGMEIIWVLGVDKKFQPGGIPCNDAVFASSNKKTAKRKENVLVLINVDLNFQ